MKEIYRILDANFNRAREALRVAEDCGRFAMNDPAITAMAKNLRSNLREVSTAMGMDEMITSRDTPGDIGTEMSSPTEPIRKDLGDVAIAACKRLTEALRTIEEYGKVIAGEKVMQVQRMRYDAYTLECRLVGRLLTGQRFHDVRVYVLITSSMCRGSVRDTARAAVAGGADAIQLREKDLPDDQVLALAAELKELTDETGKLLLINDRPDIAAIVGADGVHLGVHDLPIAEARRLLRPGAIVGRSSHSLAQARAAIQAGADYVSIGPVFPTATKDAGPLVGVDLVRQAAGEIPLPLLPIGGITAANLREVVAAGGKRVAICSAACAADNPEAAVRAIRRELEETMA